MKISNQSRVESRKSKVFRLRNFFGARPSTLDPRSSQRGIALVITLILLSVTLVMAVAFLAISNRERSSVTTTTDTTTARLAAETALAQAESQIISTMLATTNPYNYGLLVSTNYFSAAGYDTTVTGVNPTNVNYNYPNGNPITGGDFLQNLANLYLSPRVPVFIATNGGTDFRFYLDLNRNGRFDTNGYVPNVDNTGATIGSSILEVGDPEWVGVLERPDTTHGPNNKFLSRYAFIAVPVGNTLDVNYIHNQAKSFALNSGNDGYFRNQGVGSWEINLAAFLTDLNTNQWDPPTFWNAANNPYIYGRPNGNNNTGRGFEDALSFLSYRYANNYNSLSPVGGNSPNGLFTTAAIFPPFQNNIDAYNDGPLMTNSAGINESSQNVILPWVGADNANHFFTPSDFFTDISTPFTTSLTSAGNADSTYDRYTFYRMLSQLGTDSTPESGLMNVNYDNVDPGFNGALNANGTASVTNFVPWTAIGFFTNAADRMLRLYTTNWFQTGPSNYLVTYYGLTYTNPMGFDPYGEVTNLINSPYTGMTNQIPAFGITHIPVLMYGQFVYSSAVNRVLQLAANIYDATTNSFYPSVFRPTFLVTNESGFRNVYINGYEQIEFSGTPSTIVAPLDMPVDVTDTRLVSNARTSDQFGNVYGVPWIIGAKKGFPNFNEFSMQNVVQITRKLQLKRKDTNSPPTLLATNQMYDFSITNSLGVECWNSYTNAYPFTNNFQIVVRDNLWMQMSNGASSILLANPVYFYQYNQAGSVTVWPSNRFIVPLYTNVSVLPDSAYSYGGSFISEGSNPTYDDVATTPPLVPFPQTSLFTTNRLQVFMLDNNHVIDYVQFSGPDSSRNLNSEFENANTVFGGNSAIYYTNGVWSTTPNTNGVPLGIATQIGISEGDSTIGLNTTYWTDSNAKNEIDGFAHFLGLTPPYGTSSNFMFATNLAVQAPYTPTINLYQYTTWQANDPLVHYLQSDLNYSGYDPNANSLVETGIHHMTPTTAAPLPILPDIGTNNVRYQPWGLNTQMAMQSQHDYDQSPYNLAFKDPLVRRSDNWDFPTSKLPTIGWLGRVHRGTPWQTVYFKASNVLRDIVTTNGISYLVGTNTWGLWTGDTANIFDAVNSAPLQDRLLFDIFTTAPDDNATRGQLSVNVGALLCGTSLAAWSALFSGMVALTNTTTFPLYFSQTNLPVIVQPAGISGVSSALGNLVTNINSMRTNFTNPDGLKGAFEHKGDILSIAQLTESSPFLNTNSIFGSNGKVLPGSQQPLYGISDEIYEWLPQQMMSLLRAPSAPRYVIYCYGQALKPAPNSIVTGGSFFQMVTNYQVVTESAARAVIRVDDAKTPHPHIVVESFNLLPPD